MAQCSAIQKRNEQITGFLKMLLTDYIVLATAGNTVDGREIKEDYLKDIADTYDREKYTANINVDHKEWWGNYGHVYDVRIGKNKDGETTLEGRLNPNHYLVQMNKDGQKMFVSIEITPNYRNTGKAYLTGLAVTDQPASAGTSMLKFSKQNSEQMYTAPAALFLNMPGDESAPDFTPEEKTIFKKLLAMFSGGNPHEFKNQTIEQEADEMSAEQLEAMQKNVLNLSGQVEKLSGVVTSLAEKFSNEEETETETEQTDVEKLSAKIEHLESELEEFKKERPGKFNEEDHQELDDQKDCI